MKIPNILYLLLILLFVTGCPLDSKFEVGDIVPIDPKLIGEWNVILSDSDDKVSVLVKGINTYKYEIKCIVNRKNSVDTLSMIGTQRELKTGEILIQTTLENVKYSYFKYNFSRDTLRISFLHKELYYGFTDKEMLENFLISKELNEWTGKIVLKK